MTATSRASAITSRKRTASEMKLRLQGGLFGTSPRGPASSSSRSSDDLRAAVRPASCTRGDPWPARSARAVGDRACAEGGAVAARLERPCSREGRAGADRGGRDAGPPGVIARVEPFRYADAHALAAGEAPLLAVLDSVTDPRNLGAVIRSAEGAG